MEEQIKQALEQAKMLAKVMLEDDELVDAVTKMSKKYLDSYIAAGFSREEAIILVAAIAGKQG